MSQLNLVPNPVVLATQAGIFLATIVVVKKLFINPYLKVRDQRDAMTTGSQNESEQYLVKCEEITKKISEKMKDVSFEITKLREEKRQQAHSQKEEIVKRAEAQSKSQLAELQKQIKEEIQGERSKIDGVVRQLSDELFKQVAF